MQPTVEIPSGEAAVEWSGHTEADWTDSLPRPSCFEEQPKDRIFRSGAAALSDHEILAILLGVTSSTAHRMLELQGGQLGRLFAEESFPDLSPTCHARLLAARELACRLIEDCVPKRDPLRQPQDVVRYLNLRYRVRDQEIFGALFLSTSNRLIAHREIYRGTLSRISVEPREILKQALLLGAASLIVFHTHPSGDPSPSAEDQAFTRLLGSAAQLLGVPLGDHLILGAAGTWTSMRERMAW